MIKKIWTGILICVALLTLSFAAFAETAGDFSRYAGTWQEKGENGGRIVIRADGGFVHADADNVLDMEGTLERGSEEIGGTVHRTIRMTDHFGKLDDVFYDDEEGELSIADRLESDPYFDGDLTERQLQEAIATLPDKQRLVFNMKYFNEMKYEEISEALGTSVGALKASFHIAVKKIEEYFNNID